MIAAAPQPRRGSRLRRHAVVAAGVTAAIVLAACGGGSSDDSASPEVKQDGKTSAFPVTITQEVGDVTIEAEPERVVTLDFPSTDAVMALGIIPVGMAELSYLPGGVQEWTKAAMGDAEPARFKTDDGFPFETIARLDPDAIVATNTWPLISENWDKLNAIAPVVGTTRPPAWTPGSRASPRSAGPWAAPSRRRR